MRGVDETGPDAGMGRRDGERARCVRVPCQSARDGDRDGDGDRDTGV